MSAAAEIPPALRDATEGQPAARAALAAALSAGPAHAYLFAGPGGASAPAAARAFAAELLAEGAPDAESARARALADPSPHPDLAWLTPPGGQHLVDEIREQVIRAAAMRPFEGARRVFVIESAEAMADESQNALLKTLEEPPPYVHILLISSRPGTLLPTVASRCQRVRFQALSPEEIERILGSGGDQGRAAARLAGGDLARARFLASERGRELRSAAERCARAAAAAELEGAPWKPLLEIAEREGEDAGTAAGQLAAERAEAAPDERAKARARRDGDAAAKRSARKRRTETLDLALALFAAWFRDLASHAEGAPELALNADRHSELATAADGLDPRAPRRAAELALDARRRLRVNVSEELALEALLFRAEAELAGRGNGVPAAGQGV